MKTINTINNFIILLSTIASITFLVLSDIPLYFFIPVSLLYAACFASFYNIGDFDDEN